MIRGVEGGEGEIRREVPRTVTYSQEEPIVHRFFRKLGSVEVKMLVTCYVSVLHHGTAVDTILCSPRHSVSAACPGSLATPRGLR